MLNYITNLINSQKLLKFSLFLFALSLFFPIRHVFLTPEAYLTGQYSDFTSFSLYLSDILLFTTCFLLFLPRGGGVWSKVKGSSFAKATADKQKSIALLTFWLILGLILHFSHPNLYWTLKWLELIVAYGTATTVASDRWKVTSDKWGIAQFFVGLASIQSIIALLQFYKQTSLGLYRLGESHLSSITDNVAKLVVNGHTYIRGYGTFPHPNLLGAFLLVSIILSIYLYLNSTWKWQIIWGFSIFLNILGLTVTFSRAAYLSMALGLGTFFISLIVIHRKTISDVLPKLVRIIALVIISGLFSLLLFRSFLLTRATINDNAVTERVEYNNIGLRIIKDNAIFGVGAGESVLHMEQYSQTKLEPWQFQPIHNYFLLSAAELGIPGVLLLIFIFFLHIKSLIITLKSSPKSQLYTFHLTLFTILCSFLVLMLFDHYFYTLQQTQLLLWIILGVIASQTKNHPI